MLLFMTIALLLSLHGVCNPWGKLSFTNRQTRWFFHTWLYTRSNWYEVISLFRSVNFTECNQTCRLLHREQVDSLQYDVSVWNIYIGWPVRSKAMDLCTVFFSTLDFEVVAKIRFSRIHDLDLTNIAERRWGRWGESFKPQQTSRFSLDKKFTQVIWVGSICVRSWN